VTAQSALWLAKFLSTPPFMGLTRQLAALALPGRRDSRTAPMRLHFYISHSFGHADKYARLLEFMEDEGLHTADYSVPVSRQVPGDDDAVRAAITERIARCNRVLVLVTDGIHKSPYIEHEIAVAQEFGKPIIGIFPHGENGAAIPAILAKRHYRMIGWRPGSLAKAMRGEYPPESRVFDIAELEDRREMILAVGGATAAVAFLVAGWEAGNCLALRRELREKGIEVVDDNGPGFLETAGPPFAIGALLGAAVGGVIGRTEKALLTGAVLGGGIGLAVGTTRYFRLRTKALGSVTQLSLEPVTP
jgi:MTH538 TIR-like domain (DUF1863)